MKYILVKQGKKTYPPILEIYAYAREFMKKTGNPTQWKDRHPAVEILEDDLRQGQLYVVKTGEEIHGVFALVQGKEPTYARIEQGQWCSDSEYGTIHRIAGDGEIRGIFEKVVDFCSQIIPHLRIDTHENNKIMQHLIEKNGFKKCGIIYVADGSPRIAYERMIKEGE